MSNNTITIITRASRETIKEIILSIPQEAVGGSVISDDVLMQCGTALLKHIKRAFITKARGGTDDAGDRWEPLSPKTIASRSGKQSRTRKKHNTPYRKGVKGKSVRPARIPLKGKGGHNSFDKYSRRKVEILRDTGLLLDSLSPDSGSSEQVMRVKRGEVIIGTTRKGAMAHHNGVPGRLPQRRLWPPPSKWPSSWWKDILDQVKRGIVDAITQAVRRTS